MSPTELLQSRTMYDGDMNDPELMQTTLSQYQTPTYLARYEISSFFQRKTISIFLFRPEDDQPDDEILQQRPSRHVSSAVR